MSTKTVFILGTVVVLIGGLFLFFGNEETYEIKNYPSEGKTIVAFGDSLVEGIGANKNKDFVSLLRERIGEPILNLGVSGDTTRRALNRIDEVLKKDPKVVLVLLGGNDAIQRVSKEETLRNLTLIIETIQNKGAVVILLGIQGGILRDGYKKDFERIAREQRTAYVSNILEGLIGDPEFMFDQIHPNDKGNQIIADRIYPVLESLIN